MSRHRKVSGKHRAKKPTQQSIKAPTVLTVTTLMAAWASLNSAGHSNGVSVADYNAGPRPVVVEQLPAVAPKLTKATFKAAVNTQPAQQMLVATVPLVGGNGLTQSARSLAWYIQTHYPAVRSIGGVRPDALPDHPSGHAIDIMVYGNKSLGDTIAKDVLAQSNRFGVKYVIWQETYRNPSGAARWMADRGNPTANHFDHVHVTVW